MNYKKSYEEFRKYLNRYRRVTIISHQRPDGDTIGSALALYNSLKCEGISSELVCVDSPPVKFNFLKGFERFKKSISYKDSLIITLDCAEPKRFVFDVSNRELINIDHHISNTMFGDLNIVEKEVSTSVVLYKLLKEGFCINADVANALYTGLVSDSQNFTTSLTTKESFIIASELLEKGASLQEVVNRVNRYNSLAHIRVLGRAIDSLRLYIDGEVAIMQITKDDIKATGATFGDIDGVIDSAISLATVDIAVLIVEYEDFLKVSLRSKNANVSKLASLFGGGGHKNASGFEVKDVKIEELKYDILDKLKDILNVKKR